MESGFSRKPNRSLSFALGAFLCALPIIAACNSITGAGDLRLKNMDEDEEASSGGTTGGVLTGGTSGGATGSSSSSGGTSSSSSSSGAASVCEYPTGVTFGEKVGNALPQTMKWPGYPANETTLGEVRVEDLYDCDGKKGINAILFIGASGTCGICIQEAQELSARMQSSWGPMGIQVVSLVLADGQGAPADANDALTWKEQFGLTDTAVAADPGITFAEPGPDGVIGTPLITVVDPRTMEVVFKQEGSSGQYPELEALAQKNKVP